MRLVPPRRPERQHHLDLRRRSAPDHVDGRLVLARRRPAEAAHLQLDRHLRRDPRLRAQHARRLGRPRRDHHRRRRGMCGNLADEERGRDLGRRARRSRSRRSRTIHARRDLHDGLGRDRRLRQDDPAAARAAQRSIPPRSRAARALFAGDGGCAHLPRRRRLDRVAPLLDAVDRQQRHAEGHAVRRHRPPIRSGRSNTFQISDAGRPTPRHRRPVATEPGGLRAAQRRHLRRSRWHRGDRRRSNGAPTGTRAQGAGGFNVPVAVRHCRSARPTSTTARRRTLETCSPIRRGSLTCRPATRAFAPTKRADPDLVELPPARSTPTRRAGDGQRTRRLSVDVPHLPSPGSTGAQEVPPVDITANAEAIFFLNDDGPR